MADTAKTPPTSVLASLETRSTSPSPTLSPSLALDAVPFLDRSVSTPSDSSISTLSTRSRHSRASDGAASSVVRRRGYMRPQGTAFADSARNRDSVMSLGSIAHMQYYFARTGLLDGKGAQLQHGERKKSGTGKENVEPAVVGGEDFGIPSLSLGDGGSSCAVSESGYDRSVGESPTDISMNGEVWSEQSAPPMLPPTVSTYKLRPSYTEPLPDMPVLRRELKEALQDACKVLEETLKQQSVGENAEESNGFFEVQGLHLLDVVTLAIRAAKNYYTAHTNHAMLYALRSEKKLRAELYQVLDTLKRMASRNFRGGPRITELTDILTWVESIDKLLKKEEAQEQEEAAERESWSWREGDWSGREREREWLFLKSFAREQPLLPHWPEAKETRSLPTEFLKALQDGQRLTHLHNALVARSKRKFGAIKTWHTDVAKPYRMAENLRFWVKAAELTWEIKLDVPVLDVVHGRGEKAWLAFDEAVFKWVKGVREGLMEEWRLEEKGTGGRGRMPVLRVGLPDVGEG